MPRKPRKKSETGIYHVEHAGCLSCLRGWAKHLYSGGILVIGVFAGSGLWWLTLSTVVNYLGKRFNSQSRIVIVNVILE